MTLRSALRTLGLATLLLVSLVGLAACREDAQSGTTGGGGTTAATGTTTGTTGSGGAGGAGGGSGGGGGAPVDKAKDCASTFGDALTNSFGRLDGTVLAVVQPSNPTCAQPNGTHLVLQVLMGGAAYRMVVNVKSDSGDPDVYYQALPHAMPAPAWADGWHTGVGLDYANDLGVHADASFTQHTMLELVQIVTDAISLGSKISVYATSSGGASAHLVHRNGSNHDGAIVIDPDGASPTMLLFHFDNQSF
ncbi:MAG: hypothetical protein U0359_03765 [Byssovorax sp.]